MAAFRSYSITGKGLTIIANATLVFINPKASGSGSGFEILRCWVSQNANATSAQIGIQLHSQVSTFPTLVTATPVPLDQMANTASGIVGGTAGAAGTCGINASAEGAGTQTVLYADDFNSLNGWLYVPVPEERIRFGDAATSVGFGMKIVGTPATLTGWSWGVTYAEV